MEDTQTTLRDGQERKGQIERMLLQLREPVKHDPPEVGEFTTSWNRLREVPDEYYPTLVKILQAELDCRRRLGDDAYFRSRSLDAKVDAYMDALADTQKSFLNEFVRGEDPVSWVDFKLRFAQCLKARMERARGGGDG